MTLGDTSRDTLRRNVDRNEDFNWDEFGTADYLAHNYEDVRDDDRQILVFVRDFFSKERPIDAEGRELRGIDVGTGPNLYPALSMLPFCDNITLYEYSKSNVDWLRRQHGQSWPSWKKCWQGFWNLLCEEPGYAKFSKPNMNEVLAARTEVVHGNVFDLSVDDGQRYDMGTMFFVAESITRQETQFASAMDHFLDALRPNAPFAIAFMEHSGGYWVGDRHFPATDIDLADVRGCLASRGSGIVVEHVGTGDNPLRDGYSGMIVACGRAKRAVGD
jgi:hypothetical protein